MSAVRAGAEGNARSGLYALDPPRPSCRRSTPVLPFGLQQLSSRTPQKFRAVAVHRLNGSFTPESVFVLFEVGQKQSFVQPASRWSSRSLHPMCGRHPVFIQAYGNPALSDLLLRRPSREVALPDFKACTTRPTTCSQDFSRWCSPRDKELMGHPLTDRASVRAIAPKNSGAS
jgi:hypothetical protein